MSSTTLAPATKAVTKPLYKRIWDHASILIIYLIMFVILSLTVPYFFSWENMVGLSLAISTVGIVACTMLFCLASGDFDLSVENIVATSGVIAAVVIRNTGSVWLGILGGILSGGIVGLVNGVIIAKLKINALITTLAMSQVVRGLGFIISGGVAVGILKPQFYILGNNNFLGIPIPVWIMIFCFIVFSTLLNRTTYGRNTMAIGGNREAARLAGLNVDFIKIFIFTIQGFISGLAGVVLASRMTSGQPNSSVGFSLDVISACVLGGVSLSGGVGTMLGVIVGVIIMGTVQNAMNLLNIPTFYQYVVRGIILLLAVLFDQIKQKQG
ncbi:L-arabinose ABC transporter membrane protein [Hydrogenispora ethanolica]|uniref:L-arabinose ABC transporter membrane protein n=1 Tax=Hydrogenispora ethanolica TaxID=1082276 RepID=A0A4R1R8V6_HYDET|nr:L-arabinose ABC transporter permease AraH [Hydrogenispora ethanolica]TCL61999.1 L-arabinose ABC transporter membrane protein [Hydrogenispora ethanolica]